MTTAQRFRAALLIAIDPLDLEYGFRALKYKTGCARCGKERDARGPKGGLLKCCTACLELLKLYRVYGAEEAQRMRAVPTVDEITIELHRAAPGAQELSDKLRRAGWR